MKIYDNERISSSKGNQLKMTDGEFWYKIDNLGYEGLAEFLVSRLLAYTNIEEYVKYDLAKIDLNNSMYLGCKSRNFLRNGEEVITADRLFKMFEGMSASEYISQEKSIAKQISAFINKIEEITDIKNYGQVLTRILEFDGFVLNDDRHFNNIAFIRNVETSTIRPCTLFDSGAAFLSDTKYDYPLNKNIYGLIASAQSKPFSVNFDKQVLACEDLYGVQLKIDSSISITHEMKAEMLKYYDDAVCERVCSIFEHQKMLCDYLCDPSAHTTSAPQSLKGFS